jgi:diguanylate cyclase (GGDEF)-like protein
VGCALLASLWWAVDLARYGEPRFPSGGDVLYSFVLPLLMLSVAGWVRGGMRRGALVEAAVVATGAAALAWTLAIDPLLHSEQITGLRLYSYLMYVGFDLVVLALTVRVVLITRVRTPAYALMVVAASVLIVTDLTYYALIVVDSEAIGVTTSGYLTAYLLLGGAALHPSMAQSSGQVPSDPSPMSRTRMAGYLTLILVTAVMTGLNMSSGWRNPGGSLGWEHDVVMIVLGSLVSVLLVVRLWQLAAALTRRARIDGLTGLSNLTGLREELGSRCGARAGSGADLLLVDLDGFRDVNDSFGHHTGDEILREVAARLHRVTASHQATVSRLSGDEFAVLLDRTSGDSGFAGARRVADAVVRAVRVPFSVSGSGSVLITASVGALPLAADVTVDDSLRRADLALLAAQNAGGNQVEVYDAELHAARQARTRLVTNLHRAVAGNEFSVHYQPIVDLSTDRIVAAEALLRWTTPDGAVVSPAEFIPLAEQSGAIVQLGTWVIRQVCADLRDWHPRHELPVTVNVSARQLRRPDFADTVLGSLRDVHLPGSALIVELTETALITSLNDAAAVTAQLQVLRAEGVRVAIDDFGTGYSSLAYLRQLPVDILKMDGSFTAHQIQLGRPRDLAFIRAILELAGSLDLRTVAEAVETAEQADRLRTLGCQLAQGYHFGRPGPASSMRALLAAQPAQSVA